MAVPDALLELVERFDRNRDVYRSGQYNEAQASSELIDPIFKLLGWDMANGGYDVRNKKQGSINRHVRALRCRAAQEPYDRAPANLSAGT